MAQTTTEAEQLAREYVELWNDQNVSRISEVVADSFVHETPVAPGGAAEGVDGLEEFMRMITAGFPDFEASIVDILTTDDMAMVEAEFSMTHEGEFNDIPPTGNEVETASMAKVTVEDGKIQHITEYADSKALIEQLEPADG